MLRNVCVKWAVVAFKKILSAVALAALVGCGGTTVPNAAHVRFFNGFSDRQDVRAYFGDKLYSGGGVGPAIGFGNELAYGDSPSGSINIVANPYIDPSTDWATLASQTLFKDALYTVVGTTVGSTRTLFLFNDGVAQTAGNGYFRILNAAPTTSPVYVTLRRSSDDSIVYPSGTSTGSSTVGSSSGYRSIAVPSSDPVNFILHVYATSDFTNSLSADIPVTLQQGTPTTVVLYNNTSGNVLARSASDVALGG